MPTRFAACDLGKVSAAFVVATRDDQGAVVLEGSRYLLHEGAPFETFADWYRDNDVAGCAALAATGVYADQLQAPVLVLPESACQEAALDQLPELPAAINLLSVGGRGYSVLAREASGRSHYLENDKCSSGTGETMQRMAARFGMDIAAADELAMGTEESTAITARCSVFAKSEMTHHANAGASAASLFRGFFESVARNAGALLSRNRVDGPVLLIGGGSRLGSLRRALEGELGESAQVPAHATCFEALGAALLASERAATTALPADPSALRREQGDRFTVLPPADQARHRVTHQRADPPPSDWLQRPSLLGLDLGSTGSKALLSDLETGEALYDVYDRTRGDPLGATKRLVSAILEQGRPDVRAIGVTGSGREAVATVLRAVYPGGDTVVVLNEIVAHATAAMRCDPGHGEDLSVIEIGGQDAKFIQLRGGRIVESDMNMACSAGTGSFLEEQARLYDVTDIEALTAMASAAQRPPDLGQMCTVYMADAGARALKDGFGLGDVFAGLQYSIIHNYLDRVMGQRTLGATVFFQGKPATNPSLAWTLAAITQRRVVVPPNPGAMGAWGIGLCARDQLAVEALAAAPPLDLGALLAARVTARKGFTCRDADCGTLCPILRTTVSIGDDRRQLVTGGACPRYELATAARPKLPHGAPDPFHQRRALLESHFPQADGDGPRVGLPLTGGTGVYAPFLATLLRHLGARPVLLASDSTSLARGELLANAFDACGPSKIAHALCDTDLDTILFPKVMDLADREGRGGQSCVTQQAMPELVEQGLRSRGKDTRILHPRLYLAEGLEQPSLAAAFRPVAAALDLPATRLPAALSAAAAAQRDHEASLRGLGLEALAYARANDLPAVLVCGALHVVHDTAINGTIPRLLRRCGAMAIPVDCFAIPDRTPTMPKIYWADANRSLRAAAAARSQGDVYPLLITSFGCGPGSFVEHAFGAILLDHPHTMLESDGHGGTAGFVTRLQAFLQSVRQHRAEDDPPVADNSVALSHVEPTPKRGPYLDRSARYVFLSGTDYLGPLFAAVYRSYGYDGVAAPLLDEAILARGRRDCSGKECLSYQLLWGAFRTWLEANPPTEDTRLVQISGEMCRAGLFPVKDRIALQRMGLGDQVTVTSLRLAGGAAMTLRLWCGWVALDVLRQLYIWHLATESEPGRAEALYRTGCEQVLQAAEERWRGGLSGWLGMGGFWSRLLAILDHAAVAFAAFDHEPDLRSVFVSGDLLTKGNDFANGGLFHHLARHAVRALVEPGCDFIEFLVRRQPQLIFGRGAHRAQVQLYLGNMLLTRWRIYRRVRRLHPWLPAPDVGGALKRTEELLDPATVGGVSLAVGSVLHHWDQGQVDGVVLTSCWGCDNGLLEESLLRHRREIPSYFFYDDGTHLDERRLGGFAFRLSRRPARAGA